MTKTLNQLTLGQVLEAIRQFDDDLPVGFAPNIYTSTLGSYRGFYEDLAIGIGTYRDSIGEFRGRLKGMNRQTISGYKGGEYEVTMGTAVWVADYGQTGAAVTGVRYDESLKMAIIETEAYN